MFLMSLFRVLRCLDKLLAGWPLPKFRVGAADNIQVTLVLLLQITYLSLEILNLTFVIMGRVDLLACDASRSSGLLLNLFGLQALQLILELELVCMEDFVIFYAVVKLLLHRAQDFVDVHLIYTTFEFLYFGMCLSQQRILLHHFTKPFNLLSVFAFQSNEINGGPF